MGQKVNPYGFRLGVTTEWKSRWFATRHEYVDNVIEDWKIRDFLMTQLPHAAISRVMWHKLIHHFYALPKGNAIFNQFRCLFWRWLVPCRIQIFLAIHLNRMVGCYSLPWAGSLSV